MFFLFFFKSYLNSIVFYRKKGYFYLKKEKSEAWCLAESRFIIFLIYFSLFSPLDSDLHLSVAEPIACRENPPSQRNNNPYFYICHYIYEEPIFLLYIFDKYYQFCSLSLYSVYQANFLNKIFFDHDNRNFCFIYLQKGNGRED